MRITSQDVDLHATAASGIGIAYSRVIPLQRAVSNENDSEEGWGQ